MGKRFRTLEISNSAFQPDHLRYVTVKSNHLKGRGDCTFFIPPQIRRIGKSTPVVILLHGVYGSHWAWTYNINVHKIALRLIEEKRIEPMVLVMPSDGLMGDGSGYFNHGQRDFEKWIVRDVVDLVKEVVPSSSDSLKLFICGLSMGGYGALRLMGKYPTLFNGASGLSCITCLKDLLPFLSKDEQVYYRKNFKSEDVFSYLKKNRKKLPPFRFDCGKDDDLYRSNVTLHHRLEKEGIPHIFKEFSGGHSNEYWNQNIGNTLIYFNELAKDS